MKVLTGFVAGALVMAVGSYLAWPADERPEIVETPRELNHVAPAPLVADVAPDSGSDVRTSVLDPSLLGLNAESEPTPIQGDLIRQTALDRYGTPEMRDLYRMATGVVERLNEHAAKSGGKLGTDGRRKLVQYGAMATMLTDQRFHYVGPPEDCPPFSNSSFEKFSSVDCNGIRFVFHFHRSEYPELFDADGPSSSDLLKEQRETLK